MSEDEYDDYDDYDDYDGNKRLRGLMALKMSEVATDSAKQGNPGVEALDRYISCI